MGILGRKTDSLADIRKEVAALRAQLLDKMEERITLVEEALAKLKEDIRAITADPVKLLGSFQTILARAEILSQTLREVERFRMDIQTERDSLNETVELLTSKIEELRTEAQRYQTEREGLGRLREEVGKWRMELEQKERQIAEAQETLKNLELRRERLEDEIRILSEKYLTMFTDATKRLEEYTRDLDKRFRLREVLVQRLIRREHELNSKLELLESKRVETEKLIADAERLKEEVRKLESHKAALKQDIEQMEKRRADLTELINEMRKAFLTS
ncbi:MAG: hypothetical protein QW756_08380 [Nitrososphaerota archaeon]